MRSVASTCGLATVNWKVTPVAVTRAVTTPLFAFMAVMPQQGAGAPALSFWADAAIVADNITVDSARIQLGFIQPSPCVLTRSTYLHS
jgi:hypothetical protein